MGGLSKGRGGSFNWIWVPSGLLHAGLELLVWYDIVIPYACFYELGVLLVRVLTIRGLLFGVYLRAAMFGDSLIEV